MKTIFNSLFLPLAFSLFNNLPSQMPLPAVYINEFMAANSNTITSPDFQEYADWLEIYNAADTTVDISGYFLTDDLNQPQKWLVPADCRILPKSFVLFWADGRDQGRHMSFGLAQDGEQIGLFSDTGVLIDSLTYPPQTSDVSFGRYPDGSTDRFFFDSPTPGTPNSSAAYIGLIGEPQFSPGGGFYQGSVTIELTTADPNETIRYTLDGSLPNPQSPVYAPPMVVTSTSVIRAQAVRDGYLPGKVITNTYFIDETTTLPVVSVATDPANLWDDQIGIYVIGTNGITGYCSSEPRNWNQPWEKPVSLEMYEADRSFAFKIDAGMQIGGGCTRLYPQKSLAIYARAEYGFSKINYRIFADKPIDSFNNILLRNSGQDWWRAMFRDGFMHTLVKDVMDIDWLAYKPAILFLNGEYWGIHGIREKHNEHYLASNYGIDPYQIDILQGNASVEQGSAKLYTDMIVFVQTHNMDLPEYYNWVATQMDINEYLDYTIAEIYFANIDWPGGNIKYWRQKGDNHKWRWILFDTDLGFGAHPLGQYDSNTLANATATEQTYYANPPWSTLLLRKLLENTQFRNQFIQRFASHLNITFAPSRVLYIIDSLRTNIAGEIPRHIHKWEKSTSFNEGWNYHLQVMRDFATLRPAQVRVHLIEKFGLSGSARLTLTKNSPEMGSIYIADVKVPDGNFSGIYLKDIPIQCRAVANRGYRFAGWQGISNSLSDSIVIILSSDSDLEALFEIDESEVFHGLRINEILALNKQTNVDGNGDYDDWIELFNDSREAVDIGGMYITDDLSRSAVCRISTLFPDSTTIQPGQFLLLWADEDSTEGILHLNFKLSGEGEEIGLARLTDSGFTWIDTLIFGGQSTDISFGRLPDGSNNLQFFETPTPGYANIYTAIPDAGKILPDNTGLDQNYPNPFNSTTVIRYQLKQDSNVKITIFDLTGREIRILLQRHQPTGEYHIRFNASDLPSGIYICRLKAGSYTQCRKMVLIR